MHISAMKRKSMYRGALEGFKDDDPTASQEKCARECAKVGPKSQRYSSKSTKGVMITRGVARL